MMPSAPLKTSRRIGVELNHRFLHTAAVYLSLLSHHGKRSRRCLTSCTIEKPKGTAAVCKYTKKKAVVLNSQQHGLVKGIVHPKNNNSDIYVVPNLYEFLPSVEHKTEVKNNVHTALFHNGS